MGSAEGDRIDAMRGVKSRVGMLTAAACLFATALPLAAHHSFAA
jgi:hypothetical protein